MGNTIFTVRNIRALRNFLGLLATLFLVAIASSGIARADSHALLGAIIGGSTGALVGDSMGGRDGAIMGGALGAVAGVALTQAHYRPEVEYLPPPRFYRPPHAVAPAPIYYPRYERDGERHRWEGHQPYSGHRHQRNRNWDQEGYRR